MVNMSIISITTAESPHVVPTATMDLNASNKIPDFNLYIIINTVQLQPYATKRPCNSNGLARKGFDDDDDDHETTS